MQTDRVRKYVKDVQNRGGFAQKVISALQRSAVTLQHFLSRFRRFRRYPLRTQFSIISVFLSIFLTIGFLLNPKERDFKRQPNVRLGEWRLGSPMPPIRPSLKTVFWKSTGLGYGRSMRDRGFQVEYDWEKGDSHHQFNADGTVTVDFKSRHPIYDLLERAEQQWAEKNRRASKTLKQAVQEYRRRYGRSPPKGFDIWWQFVVDNNVQLPDEYDQINRDISPFLGISPQYLHSRQAVWESKRDTFIIESKDGRVFLDHSNTEEFVGGRRGEAQLRLLEPIQKYLPNFRVTFDIGDTGHQFIHHDLKEALVKAATEQDYMDPSSFTPSDRWNGWSTCCSSKSKLRSQDNSARGEIPTQLQILHQPKKFIWDQSAAIDPCSHPELTKTVGIFSAFGSGIGPGEPTPDLAPLFASSKSTLHADILTVAVEDWHQASNSILADPPWEKKSNTVVWRGGNTGIAFVHDTDAVWNISQRYRLVSLANAQEGELQVLPPSPPTQHPISPKPYSLLTLNEKLNVKFRGQPLQCDPDICTMLDRTFEFTKHMKFIEAHKHKYVLDIDGNAWSARFQRLVASNQLVLKATAFPEWNSDRIQPWLHFVPLNYNLTDFYDIMTFFQGDPITGKGGHDDIAKKLAYSGRDYSEKYWRKVDTIAYIFRLLLEYSRVMALDREAATFNFDAE